MNLRGIANSVSRVVNPNILVTVKRSDGYTIDPLTRRQIPIYFDPNASLNTSPTFGFGGSGNEPFDEGTFVPPEGISGSAQLQALTYTDLKQLDGLNIQGVKKAIYLYGVLAGVVRPREEGGDIVTIGPDSRAALVDYGEWLVVQVLENWPQWTKAVIVLQTEGSE